LITYLGSLLVGVLGFLAVGIGVTVALEPYVWLSAMLGLPAGLIAGTALLLLTEIQEKAHDFSPVSYPDVRGVPNKRFRRSQLRFATGNSR